MIVLFIFLPEVSVFLSFSGGTYIFLAKSVLPTINFLSDLGIREYAAVTFFEKFNVPLVPTLSASLTLWILNILIPTLGGIPWMLSLKWREL